ncbi:hypothetical protein TRFO_30703 [Tritrichomonas foetus]|uniref:Uncharacterized protein n=1 Tax=Tritrichomonas foetus TaxID=1144522 RepID=A0A1J4JSZ9_9EUKA|nr:hypothetical protein TRFO_30703 [Tritrichomonas foetus]|eukprot:OHT02239.1 hypothetical protein TRFO_30703 [Tritrichomonas foetus]
MARGNTTTDVSDVFDIAASILTTIMKDSHGSDPNENVLEDAHNFDVMSRQKEKEFNEKMKILLENTADKVSLKNEALSRIREKIRYFMECFQDVYKNATAKFDSENQKKFSEFSKKFQDEEDEKIAEQKGIYEHFDSYLTQILADISKTYNERLRVCDEANNALQSQLQDAVHAKHLEKGSLGDLIEKENKRIAESLEQISIQYKNKNESNLKRMSEVKSEIDSLQREISQNLHSLEDKLMINEKSYRNKHQEKIDKFHDQISELDKEIQNLRMERDQLGVNLAHSKTESDSTMSNILKEHNERMKKLKSNTSEMMEKLKNELIEKYQPLLLQLYEEMQNLEKERNSQLQILRDQQLKSNESIDLDARKLNDLNNQEIDKIKQILNKQKKILKDLIEKRDNELEGIKHEKQKVLGDQMQRDDELIKKRAAEINELMRQFDEVQKKQLDSRKISIEQKNSKKQKLLDLLKKIESGQFDNENENEAINLVTNIEKEKNEIEKSTIKQKIDSLNGKIGLLNMKLNSMEKATLRALEQYIGFNNDDENLEYDLKQAAKFGSEQANIHDLANRLLNSADKVEERKNSVLKEAEDVKKSINDANDEFERKLAQMEHHIKATALHLKKTDHTLTEKKNEIQKKVNFQNERMKELHERMSQKVNEAESFEANLENEKERFEKETKNKYESSLAEISQQPLDLEKEMEELRKSLSNEISNLKYELEVAKANTSKITEHYLKERERRQKEESDIMSEDHQNKIDKIKRDHDLRIFKTKRKLENEKKRIKEEKFKINNEFDQIQQQYTKNYQNQINELEIEIQKAKDEFEELEMELEITKNLECGECKVKKEMIKRMLDKKHQLEKRVEKRHEDQQINEKEMNSIFGRKNVQIREGNFRAPSALLDMPKTQQHSPLITKPKSKTSLATKPPSGIPTSLVNKNPTNGSPK